MGLSKKSTENVEDWIEKRVEAIWKTLQTNHLWQRMLKNTIATTLTVVLALIPAVIRVYGNAVYLAAMATVFGHPGRRFGQMAEALVLVASGSLLGVGWSVFGLYLSSLVYSTNAPAAYTIKGIFLAVALLFHGYLRSHTPRLFLFVLLLVIVAAVGLTSTAVRVTAASATQLLYPIFTAVGILLLVNSLVFPEFSSSFLGITTIETLGETVGALRDAGKYFIDVGDLQMEDEETEKPEEITQVTTEPATSAEKPAEKPVDPDISFPQRLINIFRKPMDDADAKVNSALKTVKLKALTSSKSKLRAKLGSCKAIQQECNFEVAYAVLAPRELKPISDTMMKRLVANTISLIGACESKYALMGDKDDNEEEETKVGKQLNEAATVEGASSRPSTGTDDSHDESDYRNIMKRQRKKKPRKKTSLEEGREDLELVKPRKEIEFGDIELVKYLVRRIAKPLADLQENIDRSVDVVTSCLAYCYDVPRLPSGSK
jgi:hypothetical protein